jgi:hypothetical protein
MPKYRFTVTHTIYCTYEIEAKDEDDLHNKIAKADRFPVEDFIAGKDYIREAGTQVFNIEKMK